MSKFVNHEIFFGSPAPQESINSNRALAIMSISHCVSDLWEYLINARYLSPGDIAHQHNVSVYFHLQKHKMGMCSKNS